MAVDGSIVDLHHHIDQVCERCHAALDARFSAQEQAVALAKRDLEAWKAAANEWRGAMTDMRDDFARKDSVERIVSGHKESLDRVSLEVAELRRWQSKMQGLALVSTLLAVVAVILTIVQKFT